MQTVIDPRDAPYFAVGNGTTDDTTAVTNAANYAFSHNLTLDGGRATYAVSGDLAFSSLTNPRMANIGFKQLSPSVTNRRTLHFQNCDRIMLDTVTVDRGTTGTAGSIEDAAGIWINSGSNHYLRRVEVTGQSRGNGIAIHTTANLLAEDLFVHDMSYVDSATTDDRLNGIWLHACTDFRLVTPLVRNLTGTNPTAFSTRFTRGIVLAGCVRGQIIGHKVDTVDQGVDLTGSEGNIGITLVGGQLYDCCTYGEKFANSAVRCKTIGGYYERCGYFGVVVSGPSESGLTYKTQDIEIVNPTCVDIGFNGFTSAQKAGVGVLPGSNDTDFPKGVVVRGGKAFDTQSTHTMTHGFYNEVAPDGSAKLNRIIDCTSEGHTVAASAGFHFPDAKLFGTGTVSFAHGVAAAIQWNSEDYDSAGMHNSSTNPERVYARLSGYYRLSAVGTFADAGSTAGYRRVQLQKNGSNINLGRAAVAPLVGNFTYAADETIVYLVAGDYVDVLAEQTSGAALNLDRSESSLVVTLLREG